MDIYIDSKMNLFNQHILDKHKKYEKQYKPDLLYYGLGIENELYLEFDTKINIKKNDILLKNKRERYSVDYYNNYKKDIYIDAVKKYIENIKGETYDIPLLINSHGFYKTDIYNESKNRYTKLCEPNPKFSNETFIETLEHFNPYFKDSYMKKWIFDGDTIEFTTINFFNSTLKQVITELVNNKKEFITELNNTLEKIHAIDKYKNSIFKNREIKYMEDNHPFAIYTTNIENISMFNNGTLHYNLTLPTKLDKFSNIKNFNKFSDTHSRAIKIIQWMEPFIISLFGSKDPFSLISDCNGFSKASQRCAVSRYIGIGTFDSDKMERGVILNKPITELACNNVDNWWYNKFYENNAYNKNTHIGMDIQFNKHFNHGIELRFFEHIKDMKQVYNSFEFIIYLMDFILDKHTHFGINFGLNKIKNPIVDKIWNDITYNAIVHGKNYKLSIKEKKCYEDIFKISLKYDTIQSIYYEIYYYLLKKYNKNGSFSKYVLR